MDYKDLADAIYPDAKDIKYYEEKYPARDLPEGAEVVRIGPSPTGFVHVGTIFQALLNQTIARQSNGVFYVRIEDTDQNRKIENGATDIINSLKNFDFEYDEGMISEEEGKGNYGPYKQSQRLEIYHAYAKSLIAKGRAYPCFATKEEIEEIRAKQEAAGLITGFYGVWAKYRELPVDEAIARIKNGEEYVIRLRSHGREDRKIRVKDCIKGKLEFPENFTDAVLIKKDGFPVYHFAHAVDDHLMHTTTVIRGEEWMPSLPLHIELFQAFENEPPKYAHTPNMLKDDDGKKRKISKRKDPEAAVSFYSTEGIPSLSLKEYLMNIINSSFEGWRRANPDKPTTVNPVTQNTPLQGQLGNLQGNLGSLTGTLGSTGTTGPKYEPITDEGYNGTDNVGSRWGSYGDLGLTGLELAKFLGSNYYNYLVRNKYRNLKPVHLINPLENYRIWSPKPLADQAQKVRTEAAQLGDLAARGTNDQGTAFAHRITAWDRGQKAALPYDLQYNADIKESVNTGLGVINRNNQARVTRVNGNHQADVAKYNQDQMADAQYYNHLGTQVQQLLGTMQRGVAMSNAADYENEYNNFMATDPSVLRAKNDYQAAYNAYTAVKDSGDTEAINKAYAAYNAAANRYNDVQTQKSTMWQNTHRAPLGVPFARPRRTAGYTAPFSFQDEFQFAKKGGVLEEKGRMHRHHDKLFYQSQKLLLTESNKKQRAMANGYGYLLKLMMQSK